MTPFFILCFPRSRAASLANALTYGPSTCLFEGTLGYGRFDDFALMLESWASPRIGNSDCVNAVLVDKILERWPTARLVVIKRDTDAVASSLRRLGIEPSPRHMQATQSGLMKASLSDNALVVPYEDLDQVRVGEAIWNHCVGDGFDARRWQMLADLNVQTIPEREFKKPRCTIPEVVKAFGG